MLLATVIFATALISIATVYQYIAIATAKTRTRIVGQYLAKGLMEKCEAAKYYNVLEFRSTGPSPARTYDPIPMTYIKDGQSITHVFYREVDVYDAPSHIEGIPVFNVVRARVVRVRVSWEEKNRRTEATRPFCEYTTYIGENS